MYIDQNKWYTSKSIYSTWMQTKAECGSWKWEASERNSLLGACIQVPIFALSVVHRNAVIIQGKFFCQDSLRFHSFSNEKVRLSTIKALLLPYTTGIDNGSVASLGQLLQRNYAFWEYCTCTWLSVTKEDVEKKPTGCKVGGSWSRPPPAPDLVYHIRRK